MYLLLDLRKKGTFLVTFFYTTIFYCMLQLHKSNKYAVYNAALTVLHIIRNNKSY